MFKNVSKEELTVPATMGHLSEIRDFIELIGKKFKFADRVINSFKLVVDEAATNIIRHGYMDNKNGEITIRAIIRRLSLTIVIVDQGKSFDPRQVKNPDLQKYVDIGKKGGLGIFMMRKLMDDIQYNLTSSGNELRLTKMREAPQQSGTVLWFESLSLRRKYFYVTTIGILLLAMVAYFFVTRGIQANVRSDVFAEATSITDNFAKNSWDLLVDDSEIHLNINAQSFLESHQDMISQAIILGADSSIRALAPFDANAVNSYVDLNAARYMEKIDRVRIFETTVNDIIVLYFVAPIRIPESAPLGYAVVSIPKKYVVERAASQKMATALWLLGISALLIGSMAALVTFITEPFHKLAEWVRQVGRGQADQDEIDIDSNDEVGEIAQAFNEMTNKFRDAQLSVIEQQRMRKELQVAQEIQQMLLPDDFPEVIGYDISAYYQSAKEVGGDLFDFMEVDEQSLGICVADVSGKGIPGSLVMTMIRTSLRLETRGNNNPADIITRVNGFVTDDIRKGMFVTMMYVILDSRERIVSFASAGHNPMILYRGKSKETFYLNPSGFPVGITLPDINLFGERIQADRIRLHPDDILVLYTDGITEAMNANRELYGEERFLQAIRKYGQLDVAEFVGKVKDDIAEFTGGYEQNDDITFVAIKEKMAAVDVKVNMFKRLFEETQSDSSKSVAEACKEAGTSPTTFYRYRRIYYEGGYDLLREMLHGYTNLGLRHLSIEVKTKMYDIIRKFPELGPKKISDLLNTEEYAYTEVSPLLIYEELKRAKLNTRERRESFVKRGGKQRLKPPGTPLLTLDGKVLVGFRSEDKAGSASPFMPHMNDDVKSREIFISSKGKKMIGFEDTDEVVANGDKEESDSVVNNEVVDDDVEADDIKVVDEKDEKQI